MKAVPIRGSTRLLGPPNGWDEALDGPCGHLAIRDELFNGASAMTSAYKPTPEELAILNAGGYVVLSVCGSAHPPVALWTELDASEIK